MGRGRGGRRTSLRSQERHQSTSMAMAGTRRTLVEGLGLGREKNWTRQGVQSPPSYISNCHFERIPDPCHQISGLPNEDDPYSPFPGEFNYLIYCSFSLSSIEHNLRNIVNYLVCHIYLCYFLTLPIGDPSHVLDASTVVTATRAALTPTDWPSSTFAKPTLESPSLLQTTSMPSQEPAIQPAQTNHGTGSSKRPCHACPAQLPTDPTMESEVPFTTNPSHSAVESRRV